MCIKNVTEKFCGLCFRFEKFKEKVCEEGMEGCGCEWECVVLFGVGCFGGNAEETVFVIVELDDFSVCELEGEDLICHEFIGFMAY